jgi:hypothetical protein
MLAALGIRHLAVSLASLAVLATSATHAEDGPAPHSVVPAPPRYAIHIAQATTAFALHRVLDGARARLTDPACQQVLDDFRDTEGHPLRARLERTGLSPEDYLGLVIFYDGQTHPRCAQEGIFAATSVGSRAVFVCPRELQRVVQLNEAVAEATVIHEALHTLGLGENPPTSREITAGVLKRCRH